jgi:hypothetical protein
LLSKYPKKEKRKKRRATAILLERKQFINIETVSIYDAIK